MITFIQIDGQHGYSPVKMHPGWKARPAFGLLFETGRPDTKRAARLAAALNSLDLLFELTDPIYQNLSAL
jgi:hypothetical protein